MRPIDKFVNFKHTSPFIIRMFEKISMILNNRESTTETNQNETESPGIDASLHENIEMLIKICDTIELFAYNKLNLILVERTKGVTILMNCLNHFCKLLSQAQLIDKDQQSIRKRFIISILRCLVVCLRADINIHEFVSSKGSNFLRLIKLMKEHIGDEEIMIEALIVLR